MSATPLLAVEKLRKHYLSPKPWIGKGRPPIQAVDDVSFTVERGETLALVGESGCGKTTTAKSVVRLVEPTSGSVKLEGEELTTLSAERMRQRRKDLQIVFQDPYASLDPRLAAGEIVAEPLRNFAEARCRAEQPAFVVDKRGHGAACFAAEEGRIPDDRHPEPQAKDLAVAGSRDPALRSG